MFPKGNNNTPQGIRMLLNEMEIFYYVVRLKSFTKAAETLGVSKAYISKRIVQLEQDLKTRLLVRTTRQLTLTEAGEHFYQFCANIVQESEQGYALMQKMQTEPAGLLRISMPPAIALGLLSEFFPNFLRRYPHIKLNVQLEDKFIDLVREGYDLALRVGKLQDSTLYAQKIYTGKYVFCATPEYFKAASIPRTPIELEHHNCAIYGHYNIEKSVTLFKGETPHTISIQGNLISNQLHFIKAMMLNHACIAMLPLYVITKELKDQSAQICLEDYQLQSADFFLLYPERKFMPVKLQIFIDMLKEFLEKND